MSSSDAPARARSLRRRVRLWRALPYLGVVAAAWFVLSRYSLASIQREMAHGDALALIPFAVGIVSVNLFIVAAADSIVIVGMLETPRYFDVMRGKAASVLLEIVNYAVGKGGYAAWIARKYGAGAGGAGGIMLYIASSELCSIALFAAVAIRVGRPEGISPTMLPTFSWISGVLLFFIVAGPWSFFRGRVVVFRPWEELSVAKGLLQIALRCVQHTVGVLGTWGAANAFGLELPVYVALAYVPVIGIVGAMPVNVAGFGAVQSAWLLLTPWAPGERLVAFSVLWGLMIGAGAALRGAIFVRGVMRELQRGTETRVSD